MSEASKSKSKTHFPLRLEAPLKAKALRFQPRSIMGARETLSRVEMNAQLRGALDSVSRADSPLCLFFLLTKAVVVIHEMTMLQIRVGLRLIPAPIRKTPNTQRLNELRLPQRTKQALVLMFMYNFLTNGT